MLSCQKKKGSGNRRKAVHKLRQLYTKINRCRKNRLHELSTEVVPQRRPLNNSLIAIEDLKLKNMSKSAKGTLENPGKNVKSDRRSGKSRFESFYARFGSRYVFQYVGVQS